VALALAGVLPLWTTPVVPTQDGPSHVYNAWVIANYRAAGPGLDRHFEIVPWTPNWGGVGPLVPLLWLLSPAGAEKVFLSVVLVIFVLGASRLVARCGGDGLIGAAVAGVVGHGLLFVMGFSGYLLAVGAGLLLASAASKRSFGPSGLAACAATFVVLFATHLLGALIAGALWLLVVSAPLLERGPIRPVLLRASPALVLLPLAGAQAARGIPPVFPPFRHDPRGAWDRLLELPSGFHWQALADADRLVGLGLTLLVSALLALRRGRAAQAPAEAQAMLLGAGAALVVFLLAPWSSGGGALLPERFVPLLFVLPLAYGTSVEPPHPRLWRGLAVGILACAVILRGVQYREWGELVARIERERPDVAPGTLIVAAHRIDAGSVANPLFHVWARLAVAEGAVALDDYEAAMPRGLFPVAFRPATLELAWRSRSDVGGQPPPGVRVIGWAPTR
jgi:hypothetical protein